MTSYNTDHSAYSDHLPAYIEDLGPDPDRPGNNRYRLHVNPTILTTTATELLDPDDPTEAAEQTTTQIIPPSQASLVLCLRQDDTYLILPTSDTDTTDTTEPRDIEMQ